MQTKMSAFEIDFVTILSQLEDGAS